MCLRHLGVAEPHFLARSEDSSSYSLIDLMITFAYSCRDADSLPLPARECMHPRKPCLAGVLEAGRSYAECTIRRHSLRAWEVG